MLCLLKENMLDNPSFQNRLETDTLENNLKQSQATFFPILATRKCSGVKRLDFHTKKVPGDE